MDANGTKKPKASQGLKLSPWASHRKHSRPALGLPMLRLSTVLLHGGSKIAADAIVSFVDAGVRMLPCWKKMVNRKPMQALYRLMLDSQRVPA